MLFEYKNKDIIGKSIRNMFISFLSNKTRNMHVREGIILILLDGPM